MICWLSLVGRERAREGEGMWWGEFACLCGCMTVSYFDCNNRELRMHHPFRTFLHSYLYAVFFCLTTGVCHVAVLG